MAEWRGGAGPGSGAALVAARKGVTGDSSRAWGDLPAAVTPLGPQDARARSWRADLG